MNSKLFQNSLRFILSVFIISIMLYSIPSFAQNIEMSKMTNVPLSKVLQEVSSKTNYEFAYSDAIEPANVKVNVEHQKTDLIKFFDSFFSKIGLTYKIVGKTVSLQLLSNMNNDNDNCLIKGVITDEKNEPLVGVSIIANTGNGAYSDFDGNYILECKKGSKIIFHFLGYDSYEFICDANKENIAHNVQMTPSAVSLDDIVVVAYGVKKKGTVTGSVSVVKSDKLADVPAASFDQALQGKATGLTVLSNSGAPGASATFQIRGTNSINSGTSPLFILDGIPVSSADFSSMNPADIESISVLKDASSTSIYGARAANGVVVITTKMGRKNDSDNAVITFRTQIGTSRLANDNWSMMNTSERILYEKEVGLDRGKDYDRLSQIDINWLEEVYRKNALLQNYEMQISGATDKVNYFVSGNYFDQQGISVDSNFEKYSSRANISFDANRWLRFGSNIMFTYEKTSESVSGEYALYAPISAARFMMPYWNPYNEDGSLASVNDGTWKGTGVNPIEWADNNPYINNKYKLLSSIYAQINILPNLTFKSNLGIDFSHLSAISSSNPSYKPNNNSGSVARNSADLLVLTISNTLNYKLDIKKSNLNFLLGQEGITSDSKGFSISTSGQKNDKLLDISSATTARRWSSSNSQYAYLSFFGRGEYTYDNRFFGDLSVRADGSSRFGANGRWAAFWSAGFMWNLRNENFLKDINWLSNLQLSASFGTSGNSTIPNYDHLALVSGGIIYNGQSAIAPYSLGNEDLQWEKLRTANIGLKIGLLNRLNLEVEYYNKLTSNMLMAVPISYSNSGFGFSWDNVGSMLNAGVELSANYDIIRNKKIVWGVNVNASYNNNKIKELYNGLDEYVVGTTGSKLVVDHSYGDFFLVRYAGVNSANGDPMWYDKNGNLTSKYSEDDKVMLGKSYVAPWQGGFGTNFQWNGLSVSAQFSWVADKWMLNNDRFFEENSLLDVYNQSKRMLYDRWKTPGDITDIPRHGVTPQFDTHLLEDASFLRLKNVMISYSLPKVILNRTKVLNGVRVYAQGQNLLTWTKFSGLDPESSSNIYKAQYPMSKQFTVGVELTF